MPLSLTTQILLFVAFFLAFAVKVPMWPVHTWLPDAHVEAPTGGSVVLAAIMLKLGAYGFLRFILPIVPDASALPVGLHHRAVADRGRLHRLRRAGAGGHEEADRVFVDLAHGLRHARLLPVQPARASRAALVQMISHGFVSAAMFLCVGVLYDRMHSRLIADYGGVVNTMPKFARVHDAVRDGECRACRARSGFVGEFLVILGRGQGELLARLRRRDHADPRAPRTRCGCTSA